MGKHLLAAALVLAYGPFVVMLVLYGVALVLRCSGRRSFLNALIERTKIPQPVHRDHVDGIL